MPCSRSRREQDLVGDRAAERPDAPAAQIGERAEARGVARPHGQHFAEFVVGDGDGERRASRRRVLDAAHPDVEVAARHRGVDRGDLDEPRRPPEPRDELGDLDVEADHARRVVRVGLDVRRAAFRVAAPAELAAVAGG